MTTNKELFQFLLEQKNNNKKIKLKNNNVFFNNPLSIEIDYLREIRKILNPFFNITINTIKPLLTNWNEQNKSLSIDINDDPSDELSEIKKEYESLNKKTFEENSVLINTILFSLASKVSLFSNKQFNKVLNAKLGINFNLNEAWEEPLVKVWITRNVNLIQGLTNEYTKKINDTIYNSFVNNESMKTLSEKLTEINKNFSGNRAKLIARDQIETLNAQYSQRRQREVGVELYEWVTSQDERVRSTHSPLNGKICKYSDDTVYADTVEDAISGNWKSRSSIGAVEKKPGFDINCRCQALPVFTDLINNFNKGK